MATFTVSGNMAMTADDMNIVDGNQITTVTINSNMVAKDVVDKIHGITEETAIKLESTIQLILENKKDGDQKKVEQQIIDLGRLVDDSSIFGKILSHILIRI